MNRTTKPVEEFFGHCRQCPVAKKCKEENIFGIEECADFLLEYADTLSPEKGETT